MGECEGEGREGGGGGCVDVGANGGRGAGGMSTWRCVREERGE